MNIKWLIPITALLSLYLILSDCGNSPIGCSHKYSDTETARSYSSSYSAAQDTPADKKDYILLAKTNSPGYYKITDDSVIELWDDATVADTYPTIGFYNTLAEFQQTFNGATLDNPLRPIQYSRIKGLLPFGPINDDYDEMRGTEYDVYGLIIITDDGYQYFMNTMGKSRVFTFLQDLKVAN